MWVLCPGRRAFSRALCCHLVTQRQHGPANFNSVRFLSWQGAVFADREPCFCSGPWIHRRRQPGAKEVRATQVASDKYKLSRSSLNWRKKSTGLPSTKEASNTNILQLYLMEKGGKKEKRDLYTHLPSFTLPPPSYWKKNFVECALDIIWHLNREIKNLNNTVTMPQWSYE